MKRLPFFFPASLLVLSFLVPAHGQPPRVAENDLGFHFNLKPGDANPGQSPQATPGAATDPANPGPDLIGELMGGITPAVVDPEALIKINGLEMTRGDLDYKYDMVRQVYIFGGSMRWPVTGNEYLSAWHTYKNASAAPVTPATGTAPAASGMDPLSRARRFGGSQPAGGVTKTTSNRSSNNRNSNRNSNRNNQPNAGTSGKRIGSGGTTSMRRAAPLIAPPTATTPVAQQVNHNKYQVPVAMLKGPQPQIEYHRGCKVLKAGKNALLLLADETQIAVKSPYALEGETMDLHLMRDPRRSAISLPSTADPSLKQDVAVWYNYTITKSVFMKLLAAGHDFNGTFPFPTDPQGAANVQGAIQSPTADPVEKRQSQFDRRRSEVKR